MDAKLCKIQKVTNFTHFTSKIFHTSPFKTVHIYTFAIVTMHIYTVTVTVYTIILLIAHFTPFFFSLFSMQNELGLRLLLPHLLFP